MAKVKCSRGHIYDSAIYGNSCPFCPSGSDINSGKTSLDENIHKGTKVNSQMENQNFGYEKTHMMDQNNLNEDIDPTVRFNQQSNNMSSPGTTISKAPGSGGRRVVAILTSYDTNPLGEVYRLYEGRNNIGRDLTSNICITNDSQISGKHVSILFRKVDNKFKFKDEQSSNGTFINNDLKDEGELKNFDIIKIGNTELTFIAIPQMI